jgi:hypothetical protein
LAGISSTQFPSAPTIGSFTPAGLAIDHGRCGMSFIQTPGGSVTRLLLVRDASKGKGFGPWFGPFFDEMIVKTAIHWTFKRIPVDTTDPERLARIARFRDALEQDTEADFDDEDGRVIDHDPPPPARAALPSPNLADTLSRLENPTDDQRELVRRGEAEQQDQRREQR